MPKKEEKTEEEKKEAIEKAAASVEEAIEKLNDSEGVEHEDEIVGEDIVQIKEEEKTETVIEPPTQTEQKTQSSTEEPTSEEESVEAQGQDTDAGTVFTRSAYQEEKTNSGSKAKLIIAICLIIIFTILGFLGGYLYGKNTGSLTSPATSEQQETVPTFTPTPTEEEVDLSAYSIEILNGSGVAGVAGDEQDALEADGFSVENTGNAENQDFTETTISAKSSVSPEFIQKLQDSLSSRYVVSDDTDELDLDNDYDVVVTIGSETVVDE